MIESFQQIHWSNHELLHPLQQYLLTCTRHRWNESFQVTFQVFHYSSFPSCFYIGLLAHHFPSESFLSHISLWDYLAARVLISRPVVAFRDSYWSPHPHLNHLPSPPLRWPCSFYRVMYVPCGGFVFLSLIYLLFEVTVFPDLGTWCLLPNVDKLHSGWRSFQQSTLLRDIFLNIYRLNVAFFNLSCSRCSFQYVPCVSICVSVCILHVCMH